MSPLPANNSSANISPSTPPEAITGTAPRPLQAAPPKVVAGPQVRRLKKGELLFIEGENSRAMYLLKSGVIRLYKKKMDSVVELDVVRSGQILGELAFLDGDPRSASGEALTNCELLEISSTTFQQIVGRMPDWLKLLLKTVVDRLRKASTRIRQLESSQVGFDYSGKSKKGSMVYTFLSNAEVLKICSMVLMVSTHFGKSAAENQLTIPGSLLVKYGNLIFGIPTAKIASMIGVLNQCGVLLMDPTIENSDGLIKEVAFLEKFVEYLFDVVHGRTKKHHDLSPRGFVVMSMVLKHMNSFPKDPQSGKIIVNLAEIKRIESEALGKKDSFRIEDFPEVAKMGVCSALDYKSPTEAFTILEPDVFLGSYRLQKIIVSINAVNEQKCK